MSNNLGLFYQQQELSDIVLITGIDNTRVHAHRLALAAASDYFLTMFQSTLKEATADEINLYYLDGYTLKLILGFLYTGSIEMHCSTVENILRAADYLQITTLVEACCDFMIDELDVSNCLGIALLAEQHNCTMLYEISMALAHERIGEVYCEKEFLELSKEQLSKFIFSDQFYYVSQEYVFLCICSWVEHDKARRKLFLCSLLSHVRFDLLENNFILKYLNVMLETTEYKSLILNWLKSYLSTESSSNTTAEKIKNGNTLFFATTNHLDVQTFNPNLNKWTWVEWQRLSKNRTDYNLAVINGKLIIAGGKIYGNVTNTVECMDLERKEWTELPPMKLARCWPGMVELRGHLYVVGGESGGSWSNSVEIFDFTLQSWIYSEPLRLPLSSIQVAVLNGLLYAVGNVETSKAMDCYDPNICEWTSIACKRENSLNFGIAAVDRHLYTIGGDHHGGISEAVERYDPLSNTWTLARSYYLAYLYIRCVSLNNRLIVCVGYKDGDQLVNKVEEYNPDTDNWTTLAPLLEHDFGTYSLLFSM